MGPITQTGMNKNCHTNEAEKAGCFVRADFVSQNSERYEVSNCGKPSQVNNGLPVINWYSRLKLR
jgi:hypothetical protein